jgi:hypothetical protein
MNPPLISVPLYRLAHSRSGDKGDISNLSLIAWDPECYDVLDAQVTEARVADWFAYRRPSRVTRYALPKACWTAASTMPSTWTRTARASLSDCWT